MELIDSDAYGAENGGGRENSFVDQGGDAKWTESSYFSDGGSFGAARSSQRSSPGSGSVDSFGIFESLSQRQEPAAKRSIAFINSPSSSARSQPFTPPSMEQRLLQSPMSIRPRGPEQPPTLLQQHQLAAARTAAALMSPSATPQAASHAQYSPTKSPTQPAKRSHEQARYSPLVQVLSMWWIGELTRGAQAGLVEIQQSASGGIAVSVRGTVRCRAWMRSSSWSFATL